ncbi:hypothetical protein F5878DRAFT_645715, partial [Lentinula raphanica]
KILGKYVKAYLLSSATTSYIKCGPEQFVIDGLRAHGVGGLPEKDEDLKKYLSETFIQERSHIKSQIKNEKNQNLDIGTLAQTLIGNLKDSIPITRPLMQRIALIRKIIVDRSVINDREFGQRDFWPLVDDRIAELMGFNSGMPKTQEDIESQRLERVVEFGHLQIWTAQRRVQRYRRLQAKLLMGQRSISTTLPGKWTLNTSQINGPMALAWLVFRKPENLEAGGSMQMRYRYEAPGSLKLQR